MRNEGFPYSLSELSGLSGKKARKSKTTWPKLVSVKRNERSERLEDPLFERSEFRIFSERRKWSSEAGSALNFWLLFF